MPLSINSGGSSTLIWLIWKRMGLRDSIPAYIIVPSSATRSTFNFRPYIGLPSSMQYMYCPASISIVLTVGLLYFTQPKMASDLYSDDGPGLIQNFATLRINHPNPALKRRGILFYFAYA